MKSGLNNAKKRLVDMTAKKSKMTPEPEMAADEQPPMVSSNEESVPEESSESQPSVSVPEPMERGEPMPEMTEGEDWAKGEWAGLDQWTCKINVLHPAAHDATYRVPCNRTYFSFDALMEHIRDDHT